MKGFPDFFPPQYVTDALRDAALSTNPFIHQYTRSYVSHLVMGISKDIHVHVGQKLSELSFVYKAVDIGIMDIIFR